MISLAGLDFRHVHTLSSTWAAREFVEIAEGADDARWPGIAVACSQQCCSRCSRGRCAQLHRHLRYRQAHLQWQGLQTKGLEGGARKIRTGHVGSKEADDLAHAVLRKQAYPRLVVLRVRACIHARTHACVQACYATSHAHANVLHWTYMQTCQIMKSRQRAWPTSSRVHTPAP